MPNPLRSSSVQNGAPHFRILSQRHKKPTITPIGDILSPGKDKTHIQIIINQSIILHLTKQASSFIPHRPLGEQSKSGMVPLLAVTNKHLSALGKLKLVPLPKVEKPLVDSFLTSWWSFLPVEN